MHKSPSGDKNEHEIANHALRNPARRFRFLDCCGVVKANRCEFHACSSLDQPHCKEGLFECTAIASSCKELEYPHTQLTCNS